MDPSDAFFRLTHLALQRGYDLPRCVTPTEYSGRIALELARRFVHEGQDAEIHLFTAPDATLLAPVPLLGTVRFTKYSACVVDGIVHDPVLPGPRPLDTYRRRMFAQPTLHQVLVDAQQLRAWFSLRRQ